MAALNDPSVRVLGALVDWQQGSSVLSLVSTYGAAVSYIYASDDGFGNYANGVFDGCTSQTINHSILVVGYGTDEASFWLVPSSMGFKTERRKNSD